MKARRHAPRPELVADFRVFLFLVWRHLGLPSPSPIQYDIARYLQHGPRRKMVMAFRGVGKSWIYAAYILWRLYCEPDAKILLVSASKAAADQLSTFVRRLIAEMPIAASLRPRPGARDGASAFDVGPARAAKDPSVRAVGITGQITGGRADEILADDIETASNALTQAARDKLSEAVREFEAVIRPGGGITYLGTPQTRRSIYRALPERGYDVRIWPAEIPADETVYGGRLAPYVAKEIIHGAPAGAPLDPERFDHDELASRREAYGEAGYALQFLLDERETERSRHPLRLGDLIVMDLKAHQGPVSVRWGGPELDFADDPGLDGDLFRAPAEVSQDWSAYGASVLGVDPSGRGADETAYVVLRSLNGRLFLTAAGGLSDGYEDSTLAHLAQICAASRVGRVVVESNFGDGMFQRLLSPHLSRAGARATVEEVRSQSRKELRMAGALEPVMAQHRLVVDRAVVIGDLGETAATPARGLFFQIARLTRDPRALSHDDRIDALAIAVAALRDAMRKDTERAAEGVRARRLKGELRAINGVARGTRRSGRIWNGLR